MKESTPSSRPSRAEAAASNRRRVIDAAEQLLLADGWAGTTIRKVATRADVSQETVYKGFGGKAALLKAVYDVRIAGDDSPVPIAQRENVARLRAATTPQEAADAWATHALSILGRSSPLMALALGAQADEPELAEFVRTTDAERLVGAERTAGHWAGLGWLRLPQADARDRIWLLGSPTNYLNLTALGWDHNRQHQWLCDAVLALVLDPSGPSPT